MILFCTWMKKRGINSISCFQFPFPNKSEKLNSTTEMKSSDISLIDLVCSVCCARVMTDISYLWTVWWIFKIFKLMNLMFCFRVKENDLHNKIRLCSEFEYNQFYSMSYFKKFKLHSVNNHIKIYDKIFKPRLSALSRSRQINFG